MAQSGSYTIPGQLGSIGDACAFIVSGAEQAGFSVDELFRIELACDEACTNIIEHAYSGEDRGDIECTCRVDEVGLTVILRDHGQPFDPDSIPAPNFDASLEERDDRGLGLYFLRQLMDEAYFAFAPDSGNVLTMVKRRAPETST